MSTILAILTIYIAIRSSPLLPVYDEGMSSEVSFPLAQQIKKKKCENRRNCAIQYRLSCHYVLIRYALPKNIIWKGQPIWPSSTLYKSNKYWLVEKKKDIELEADMKCSNGCSEITNGKTFISAWLVVERKIQRDRICFVESMFIKPWHDNNLFVLELLLFWKLNKKLFFSISWSGMKFIEISRIRSMFDIIETNFLYSNYIFSRRKNKQLWHVSFW